MIVNPGSGGIKLVASGTFIGAPGATLTLPQPASIVIIGEYTYDTLQSSTPTCKAAFILTPGMKTSGLVPETAFKEDAVTLEMSSAMGQSAATRTYIAFA